MKLVFLVIALAFSIVGLAAQTYTFTGIGGMKCGTFVTQSADGKMSPALTADIKAWTTGFMEGAAKVLNLPRPPESANVMFAKLQSYCAGHNDDDLNEGAAMLVLETYGRRR